MSHSMRQQLVQARRFDIHNCANQIASLVSQKMIASPDSISSVTYTYDGDCLEVTQGKNTYSIGKRLTGDFFDTIPGIEIEIISEIKEKPDIDGYYYHTLDKNTDDGLIEVIAYLDNDSLKSVKYDYLKRAIQSILVHEMQHVVQRCYSKIDILERKA